MRSAAVNTLNMEKKILLILCWFPSTESVQVITEQVGDMKLVGKMCSCCIFYTWQEGFVVSINRWFVSLLKLKRGVGPHPLYSVIALISNNNRIQVSLTAACALAYAQRCSFMTSNVNAAASLFSDPDLFMSAVAVWKAIIGLKSSPKRSMQDDDSLCGGRITLCEWFMSRNSRTANAELEQLEEILPFMYPHISDVTEGWP